MVHTHTQTKIGDRITNSRVLLAETVDAVERILAALCGADTGRAHGHKVAHTLGVDALARHLALLTLLAARQRDQRREDNNNKRGLHRSSSLRKIPEKTHTQEKERNHSLSDGNTLAKIKFQDGRNCYLKQ